MARNLILLLIALTVEQVDEAVDCILHLWYSALVRESHIKILQRHIRPLFAEVSEKMRLTGYRGFFGKKWRFRQCSLFVTLETSSWNRLLSFLDKPVGLTTEHAREVRTATTLAESRIDYRDRHLCCLSPVQRIAFAKFRQDGLLLPFGHPRHEFREPNP